MIRHDARSLTFRFLWTIFFGLTEDEVGDLADANVLRKAPVVLAPTAWFPDWDAMQGLRMCGAGAAAHPLTKGTLRMRPIAGIGLQRAFYGATPSKQLYSR